MTRQFALFTLFAIATLFAAPIVSEAIPPMPTCSTPHNPPCPW